MSKIDEATPQPDNITELLIHARLLVQLLENPQPGLYTWRESVNARVRAIGEFHA